MARSYRQPDTRWDSKYGRGKRLKRAHNKAVRAAAKGTGPMRSVRKTGGEISRRGG